MQKIFSTLILLSIGLYSFADSLFCSFQLPDYKIIQTEFDNSNYSQIIIDDVIFEINPGMPEIPKINFMLALEGKSNLRIKIHNIEYTDTIINPLLPSVTPSKTRVQERHKNVNYIQDKFLPESVVRLAGSFQQKGITFQNLVVYPFQFNSANNILRIIKHIDYSVLSDQSLSFPSGLSGSLFDKKVFLNYNQSRLKSATIDQNLIKRLLIVSDPLFVTSLQDFVSWKRQKGFIVELVTTDVLSTPELIKAHIALRYQQNNVDFVLLAGDAEQIPPIVLTTGASDQAYVYLEGDDSYPELPIGRFSGKTAEQIELIARKVIETEQMTVANSKGYDNYLLVASEEGLGDNNEYDYEHLQAIESRLLQNGYESGFNLFDGTHGTTDAPGNPDVTDFVNALNANPGLLFYTGHGNTEIISTTGFNITSFGGVQNSTLPIGMFAGCQIGNFDFQNSLAEAFVQSNNTGSPTGLVAVMASTEDQWWDPPMLAQDEFVDFALSDNLYKNPQIGILFQNSLIAMNNAYDTYGFETTDNWVLFGDPSMQIITDTLSYMNIETPSALKVGDSVVVISSDIDSAVVCITQEDSLLAISYLFKGENKVSIPYLQKQNDIKITISALNRESVMEVVPVTEGDTVFIVIAEVSFHNEKLQSEIAYYDTVFCSIKLLNPTSFNGNQFQLTVTSENGVLLSNNTFLIPGINSNELLELKDLFTFKIPNNKQIEKEKLTFTLHFANRVYVYESYLKINYPKIVISDVVASPTDLSNNDSYPEAGEIMLFTFYLKNITNFKTGITDFSVSGVDYASLYSPSDKIEILPGNIDSIEYIIAVPTDLHQNESFFLECSYSFSGFTIDTLIQIKTKPFIEDWESNTTTTYNWQIAGNEWILSTTSFAGSYSLQSDMHIDSSKADLDLTVNVLYDGFISFYAKVSSEESYDELYFFIDGEKKLALSGEKDWKQFTFPISAGIHSFKWSYTKDFELSEGDDCAWIDNIVFPEIMTSDPGDNFLITNTADFYVKSGEYFTILLQTNTTDEVEFTYISEYPWLSLISNGDGTVSISGTPPLNTENDTVRILVSAQKGEVFTYKYFTIFIEGKTSGIDSDNLKISFYPNPTDDFILLKTNFELPRCLINIYASDGKLLKSYFVEGESNYLDFSDFQSGEYYIVVKHEMIGIFKEIVIKK